MISSCFAVGIALAVRGQAINERGFGLLTGGHGVGVVAIPGVSPGGEGEDNTITANVLTSS